MILYVILFIRKIYELLDYNKVKFIYCLSQDIINTIEFLNNQYVNDSNLLVNNNIINNNNNAYFYNNISLLLQICNKFQTKFILNNFSQKN